MIERIKVFMLRVDVQRRLRRQKKIMGRAAGLEELKRIAEEA